MMMTDTSKSAATLAREKARKAHDFLESKGSATTIANYLSDYDFGGRKGSADACPIAHYLSAKIEAPVVVGSESYVVMVMDARTGDQAVMEIESVYQSLGDHVQQFIRLFDSGVYPDLDVDKRD